MRLLERALLLVLLLSAALYAGDYLSLRFRFPYREPTEAVQIRPFYAVPQKDPKREELIFLDPQTEVCTHSLFPQMGHRPCWYVVRHTQKRIQM